MPRLSKNQKIWFSALYGLVFVLAMLNILISTPQSLAVNKAVGFPAVTTTPRPTKSITIVNPPTDTFVYIPLPLPAQDNPVVRTPPRRSSPTTRHTVPRTTVPVIVGSVNPPIVNPPAPPKPKPTVAPITTTDPPPTTTTVPPVITTTVAPVTS